VPTERQHGGAALIPINLTAPALRGLNTEAEGSLLTPEWATVLTNCVFDSAGRASVRKGFISQTATPASGVIMRVHEYVKANGTIETISSTDSDIFKTTSAPTTIEGTLGITEGNIKFVNLNDKCIALGTGTSSNPSVYTGAGNFTTVSVASGTAPTGRIGTSAFGRLWVTDSDGHTIRYSALLDETKWDAADGGGTIDMARVWPSGQDVVTGIEEFAGDLVIFGQHNTVIWTDGAGSDIGINPLNIYISDTIPGIGCVSQFAIARAKGDLWFLSYSGMQSLNRAMQDKTTPTNNVSKNVQSATLAHLANESDKDNITLEYSPTEDFVLCVFPQNNKVLCFDTRGMMEDGSFRATQWDSSVQTVKYFQNDQQLYGSLTGTVGEIMKYIGFNDDGTSYDFAYQSGWLEFGEVNQYLKFVKRLTSFMFIAQDTNVVFNLFYDFNSNAKATTVTVSGESTAAEFGDSPANGAVAGLTEGSEFTSDYTTDPGRTGIGYIVPLASTVESDFGGGVSLQTLSIPGKGGGQYIKVGCSLSTADGDFALQQINLYAKVGRIA